jgi:hypothetical protein
MIPFHDFFLIISCKSVSTPPWPITTKLCKSHTKLQFLVAIWMGIWRLWVTAGRHMVLNFSKTQRKGLRRAEMSVNFNRLTPRHNTQASDTDEILAALNFSVWYGVAKLIYVYINPLTPNDL